MSAPKDPQALRQRILDDPNTAKIAEKIGVPLEQYVADVMHFVQNPGADPSVYVVEDEDLRSKGYEPPDADAIGRYLIEAAAVASAADSTEWTDPAGKKLVDMSGPQAATQAPETTDPALKDELSKALRAGRSKKG